MKNLLICLISVLFVFSFFSCNNETLGNTNTPSQAVEVHEHNIEIDYIVEDEKLLKVESCKVVGCDYLEKTVVSDDFIVATPENINSVINSVNTGVIYLSAGTYEENVVFSHSPEVTEAFELINNEYKKVDNDELLNNKVYHYFRTVEDMAILASNEAVLDGVDIKMSSGHCFGQNGAPLKDPMRPTNATESTVSSYYSHLNLKNISFDNLTFTNNGVIDLSFYQPETSAEGVTITNSVFTGEVLTSGNSAIHAIADQVGMYKDFYFANITVDGAFQGIYVHGVENVTVTNSSFKNTYHNAIAIQNGGSNYFTGIIAIENNMISDGSDRAIRFGTGENATISIKNNTFSNTGDSDGELIKSQNLTNCTYTFENNTYDDALLENTSGSGNILISR